LLRYDASCDGTARRALLEMWDLSREPVESLGWNVLVVAHEPET
jgi:hypothetical protein